MESGVLSLIGVVVHLTEKLILVIGALRIVHHRAVIQNNLIGATELIHEPVGSLLSDFIAQQTVHTNCSRPEIPGDTVVELTIEAPEARDINPALTQGKNTVFCSRALRSRLVGIRHVQLFFAGNDRTQQNE